MQPLGFNYNGKLYTASLISSDAEAPEFFWCFLDNNDLISEVGDCVSFVKNKESLQPIRTYGEKYHMLIDSIKSAILPYLKRD